MFRGLHTGPLCSDETHLRTHHFLLGHTLQAPTRRVPVRLLQSSCPRSKTHPPTPGPLLQGRHLSELQTSLSFLVYTSLWLTCPARLGGRAPTHCLFGKGSQGTEAAEKAQGHGWELPGPGPLGLDPAPALLSSKPIFVKLHLHL